MKTKPCQYCGEEFNPKVNRYGEQKHCSKPDCKKAARKQYILANHEEFKAYWRARNKKKMKKGDRKRHSGGVMFFRTCHWCLAIYALDKIKCPDCETPYDHDRSGAVLAKEKKSYEDILRDNIRKQQKDPAVEIRRMRAVRRLVGF